MSHEFLKLKWNGHMTSFLEIFQSLRSQARYTDATLACEGHLFTVHRLVLASCSPFFDHIFEQTPAENTVIILNDAKAEDIRALLDYMYCGEVEVEQNSLPSFIRTAKCLQVKGLASPDAVEPTRKVSRCSTEPEHGQKRQRSDSYNSFHGKSDASGVIGSSVLMNCNSSKVRNGPRSSSTYSRCGFQRSDLPNTTWSSSASQLDSDKKENESLRCNTTTHRAEPRPIDGCAFVDSCYPSNTLRPSVLQSHLEEPSKFSREYLSENGQLTYSDERPERYIKAEIKQERTDNFIEDLEHNSKTEELEEHSLDYVNNPPVSKDPYEDRYTNHMLQSGGVAFDEQHLHEESFERHADSSNHTAPTTSHSTLSPKLMPYAECSNCFTKNTKLWRRSISGEIVCNACGLYYKLHGVNRPSHLFRSAPMTRRRNPRKKKKYDGCAPRSELCPPEERSDFASSDAYYHEATGEDPDAQDGLAVLNAALTLNSLFAKAKAQEAASRGHGAPHATRPMVDSANGAVGAHDVERNLGHERRRAGTPPSLEIISDPRFTSSMRGVHPYSQSFEVQSQPGNDSSVMEEPEGAKISIYS